MKKKTLIKSFMELQQSLGKSGDIETLQSFQRKDLTVLCDFLAAVIWNLNCSKSRRLQIDIVESDEKSITYRMQRHGQV